MVDHIMIDIWIRGGKSFKYKELSKSLVQISGDGYPCYGWSEFRLNSSIHKPAISHVVHYYLTDIYLYCLYEFANT